LAFSLIRHPPLLRRLNSLLPKDAKLKFAAGAHLRFLGITFKPELGPFIPFPPAGKAIRANRSE